VPTAGRAANPLWLSDLAPLSPPLRMSIVPLQAVSRIATSDKKWGFFRRGVKGVLTVVFHTPYL
jgi:hypothetical protein